MQGISVPQAKAIWQKLTRVEKNKTATKLLPQQPYHSSLSGPTSHCCDNLNPLFHDRRWARQPVEPTPPPKLGMFACAGVWGHQRSRPLLCSLGSCHLQHLLPQWRNFQRSLLLNQSLSLSSACVIPGSQLSNRGMENLQASCLSPWLKREPERQVPENSDLQQGL